MQNFTQARFKKLERGENSVENLGLKWFPDSDRESKHSVLKF